MSISLPLLQQREIEANIIAPIIRAFTAEVGADRARVLLTGVIIQLAEQSGCAAAQAVGGNGLRDLRQAIERWRAGGALELDLLREDDEAFEFNVVRCQYAEMYQRLGIAELGAILSCNRDAAMIAGFNPDIEFARTQTLLGGATHCDFRFRKRPKDPAR